MLPNGKVITFNDQQFEGLRLIKVWLKGDKNLFTLAGAAGTGKSTIVKKLLDDYHGGVCVSAPTHKAVKVISNLTDKDGKTIQSLCGLRPDVDLENFSPNEPQFAPIAVPKINDYNFIIFDEASMLNAELFKLVASLVVNTRTKILFLGDPYQLPPVGEDISVVFTDESIEKFTLTKVERQNDGNPLMPIYDALRSDMSIADGGYKRTTNINENGEGVVFTVDKSKFRELIFEKFTSEEYVRDYDYIKGLAWKNETVMAANKIIRTKLFGNKTDIVEVGDVLMGYRTISNERQNYIIIQNSADYRVVKKFPIEENEYGILGYRVKLREDLARGKFKFDDVFIIDSSNHNNLHLYAQMHDFFRDMAKENKKAWVKYYSFRRNNLLMVDIDKHINGTPRNRQDCIKKDITYGFFITTHKAQGSTYINCAVIESDINDNWNVVERNKLRYVAMSRPSKSCIMLTNKIDD